MTDIKVAFAEREFTVHKLLDPSSQATESVILLPGQTIPLDELADYQKEAILSKKIPGLVALTQTSAKKRADEAEKIRAAASSKYVEAPEEVVLEAEDESEE